MSEEQKKRTVIDVQQEYQQSCMQAGHVQYQIFTLDKDLELLNQKLRDLNMEAAAIKAEEDKKAAEAPKPVLQAVSDAAPAEVASLPESVSG